MSIQHPLYGNVMMNAWLPVMAHKTNKSTKEHEIIEFPLYEIMFVENGDPGFIIRNKKTKKKLRWLSMMNSNCGMVKKPPLIETPTSHYHPHFQTPPP